MQPIIVTHVLSTKTAFGVTSSRPPEAVFIPGKISAMLGLVEGQEVNAQLVPNTMQPERTPWLAVRVELKPPAAATPREGSSELVTTLEDRVLEALRDGGEWGVADMATHLGADPSRVGEVLEAAYNRDLCAKYQLWRKRSDAEPSDEWFTCYPDEVEFVSGAEA
jgi:antitoxin component of MazEF toxin-antitoxin module